VFTVISSVLDVRKELNLNTLSSVTPNKNAYPYHVTKKSRGMRWVRHEARTVEVRGVYKVSVEIP
jgi:hypothetical protein